MRYHRDAFKWKEININMWGYTFWNQLGPLILDRELDCPAPDLQNLVRPDQAKLIVCMPSYKWDLVHPSSKVRKMPVRWCVRPIHVQYNYRVLQADRLRT